MKIQYNRNRYYDYYTGRWFTQDPLGITPNPQKPNMFDIITQYQDSLCLYSAFNSNPAVNSDASGLITCYTCGADITDVLIDHFNEFISQPQGNLNPLWFIGGRTLVGYARRNAPKIRREADKVVGCITENLMKCHGAYTICEKCFSGYHIDHFLIMIYMAESYGIRRARASGQYNESFWIGFWLEGSKFGGSSDAISLADLTLNEVALCISRKMKHADINGGVTDLLTNAEMCDCAARARMDVIGKKPAVGTGGTDYADCEPCKKKAKSPKLEIPPIDL